MSSKIPQPVSMVWVSKAFDADNRSPAASGPLRLPSHRWHCRRNNRL
jgi:hypothetical protein